VRTRKPASSRSPAFLRSETGYAVTPQVCQTSAIRIAESIREARVLGEASARVFLLYALFGAAYTLCADSPHELVTNRTRLIRDAALASGKTCIACGRDAVAKVGNYPVCAAHQVSVAQPDPDRDWKRNVRARHKRIAMRACKWCGRRDRLSRHHEWKSGTKGQPPRPVVLCGLCHAIADGRVRS